MRQGNWARLAVCAGVLGVGMLVDAGLALAQSTEPSANRPSGRSVEDLIEGEGIYARGVDGERVVPPAPQAPAAQTGGPQGTSDKAAPVGQAPVDAMVGGGAPAQSALPSDGAAEPIRLEWRVENPFRFFTDPADTELHRQVYLALPPEKQAKQPILAAEQVLSRRYDDGWAQTMYDKTCWQSSSNRHECAGKGAYATPESHSVILDVKGVVDDSVDCTWRTRPLDQTGKRSQKTVSTKLCKEPLQLTVPYPTGLAVSIEIGGVVVAATNVVVKDLLVVGMGDSFGSGEGNPDVPVRFNPERTMDYFKGEKAAGLQGYPARVGPWKRIGDKAFQDENARWLDQACHRSLYSFELRTALQLAIEEPHRAITYVGLACSGAEVTFGLFLRYKGNEWVPKPPDLSQISAAADAQCGREDAPIQDLPEAYHMKGVIPELQGGLTLKKCPRDKARKIDLLLVSIGGNDIGFARLVANAVLADDTLVRSLGGWFGQVHGNRESEQLLERLDERYKALNRAVHGILHIPWEQSDRVVLTGYPPLAVLDDRGNVCPDGNAGMEVFRDFSLAQRSALSSAWLADKLEDVMEASVKTHGWTRVSDHQKAFVGRGLCAGHTNGAGSVADDLRLPRRVDELWVPYNPANFKPYTERKRWFRTPNDAFMTGNFHVAGSVIQKVLKLESLSWFQILLASTYSGAFHPTAEGHAAIADAVVVRAREVLAKYDGKTK